jgi:cyclic pyranopterin phosphate synthase
MPKEGVALMKHNDILSFEEIFEVVKTGADLGITKVRITGGEPLVRKGIVDLIKMLAEIDGIEDLAMTTNGFFLEKYAKQLAEAGLHRVNVSLDTLDPEKFKTITRVGNLEKVLNGIEAAKSAGLTPIKINCVIKQSKEEEDAQSVTAYCKENKLEVRYIKEMDLEGGVFSKVIGGEGGHCAACNRLRLTANGMIKPCLFSDLEFDVRALGIQQAYLDAIGLKPKSGTENKTTKFSNIGG